MYVQTRKQNISYLLSHQFFRLLAVNSINEKKSNNWDIYKLNIYDFRTYFSTQQIMRIVEAFPNW